MDRWKDRVAIVTGASSGIGYSIAKNLAENNIKVVAVARRLDRLEKLANEVKGIYPQQCDVTSDDDIIKVVNWTIESLGSVDILINNAGVGLFTPLSELDTAKMKCLFDTNIIGLSLFTREVIKAMNNKKINDGHIFHISSIQGHRILDKPGSFPYAASKHAVKVLTEGLRRELRDIGTKIKITSISPGLVNTEIFEAKGMSKEEISNLLKDNPYLNPQDISDALLYALGTPPHVQVHDITILPVGEKY